MKKFRWVRRLSCALLSLCLVLLAGCQGEKEGKTTVTVCEVTHSIFYAPQYAAIHLGFFEEEGIELELSNGQGADKVMAAVLSESVVSALPVRSQPSTSTMRARRTFQRSLPR